MGDAIKRRIEKTTVETATAATDPKTAERLRSEEAQRKAYEARRKAEAGVK